MSRHGCFLIGAALAGAMLAAGPAMPQDGAWAMKKPLPTAQWTERAPLPQPRDHMALVAVDGRLHAIGGRLTNPASRVGTHDIYDPKTDSWAAGPPLPTARSGLAYANYQGQIVVLGGELAPDTFPNNEAYDPKSMRWRTLASMPAGRHGTGAAVIGKNLYVAAGSLKPGSGEVTDQLIVFTMP